MRQFAMRISGSLRIDGTIDVRGFEEPAHLVEVPSIQKGFSCATEFVTELQTVAKDFIKAMEVNTGSSGCPSPSSMADTF
jgi:hypothetical protein